MDKCPNKLRLKKYLPFLDKILANSKKPEFEKKLRSIKLLITDDFKVLTKEAADGLEKNIRALQNAIPMPKPTMIKEEPKEPIEECQNPVNDDSPSTHNGIVVKTEKLDQIVNVVPQSSIETDKEDSDDDAENTVSRQNGSSKRRLPQDGEITQHDKSHSKSQDKRRKLEKSENASRVPETQNESNTFATERNTDSSSGVATESGIPKQVNNGTNENNRKNSDESSRERVRSGPKSKRRQKKSSSKRLGNTETVLDSDDEEKKEKKLREILNKLSQPGEKDTNLFEEFKNILGKASFESLKHFFIEQQNRETPKEALVVSPVEDQIENSTESHLKKPVKLKTRRETICKDQKPLFDRSIKVKAEKGRKHREIERLNEDIMNCFLRDGILAASNQGSRLRSRRTKNSPQVKYKPSSDESTSDDETLSTIKTNSSSASISSSYYSASTRSSSVTSRERSKSIANSDRASSVASTASSAISNSLDVQKIKHSEVVLERLDLTKLLHPYRIGPDNKPVLQDLVKVEKKRISDENAAVLEIVDSDDEPQTIIPAANLPATPVTAVSLQLKAEMLSPPPVPSIRNILTVNPKRVGNLSFTECRGGLIYRCNAEKCTYEDSGEEMFKYHLQTRHGMARWDGHCLMCGSSVRSLGTNYGQLLDEFNHMSNCHIKHLPEPIVPTPERIKRAYQKKSIEESSPNRRNSTSTIRTLLESPARIIKSTAVKSTNSSALTMNTDPPMALVIERSYSLSENAAAPITNGNHSVVQTVKTSNMPVEEFLNPPKLPQILKLRKLPGDKLSASCAENAIDSGAASPVPKILEMPQQVASFEGDLDDVAASALQMHLQQINPSSGDGASPVIDRNSQLLRPWMDPAVEFDLKTVQKIHRMLETDCLESFFKCMDGFCSSFSSVQSTFIKHLQEHQQRAHEIAHEPLYRRCAYCPYSSDNAHHLANHIVDEHAFDQHSCSKCFYRSISESNVRYHQAQFHSSSNDPPPRILKSVQVKDAKTPEIPAAQNVKDARAKFVSSISCAICKTRFYVFEHYKRHLLQTHRVEDIRHRCNKCLEESNFENLQHHLEICHNIQPYHCLHCKFGAQTEPDIVKHIVNSHPSKIPVYAARIDDLKNPPMESSSIEHVAVKVFKFR